jgi:hypothetical protein
MTRQLKTGPRALATLGALLTLITPLACSDTQSPASVEEEDLSCSINSSLIQNGGPGKDGIPALTNPTFVQQNEAGAAYVRVDDRVAGIIIDGEAFAIPLNIFWWHEIVNLTGGAVGATHLTVTHCPLTGSTMAFDRDVVGGAEFGVSGLLYLNNLIMYDRANPNSLWPQMLAGARCGPKDGTQLTMSPIVEMTWAGWRSLHPGTWVVSDDTGWSRNYQSYPYGAYDNPDNAEVLFNQNVDTQRPPKERVLGVPLGSGGLAFPFGVLDDLGPVAVAQTQTLGQPLVVFWDRFRQAAMAYEAEVDGETLTFSIVVDSVIDDQTQTTWRVDGLGLEGPLAGVQLEPVAEAFVAYWFAWPAFYPEMEIWTP